MKNQRKRLPQVLNQQKKIQKVMKVQKVILVCNFTVLMLIFNNDKTAHFDHFPMLFFRDR